MLWVSQRMIARIQQVFTCALVLVAFGWLGMLGVHGHFFWAITGVVVVLLGLAFPLACEFVLLAAFGSSERFPNPTFGELVRAWWRECLAASRVFLWHQPFRSRAIPDWLPPEASRQRGVLLVHGLFCNRGFWNRWLETIRCRNVPFIALTLEPAFGSIDRYAGTLEAAARRLREATGFAPVVVAHSMGGLAVRSWIASGSAESADVDRVFTVGTPHQGTWMARFSFTENGRQMRHGSQWLEMLRAREAADVSKAFVCYFSNCDNIVFPPESATLAGADNRLLTGSPHVHMASRRAIQEAVFAELERPSSGATAPGRRSSLP